MQTETLIIGAGISGLSTAHFLSKKSDDFLIVESKDSIGGIIQSKSIKNFICENGPNTVLLNNNATLELIQDLGLWNKIIYPEDYTNKLRYVFNNDKLTKIPNSILEFLSTDLISFKSKILLFTEIFKSRHKNNTTVSNFIISRFGKEIYEKLFEPFLTGIYAGDTNKMSAMHSLKKLWNIEQKYGSIIKGLFYEKKKHAKSFSFPRGLQHMIDELNVCLKKNILKKTEVKKILKKKIGYEVIANNFKIKCKNIISTVPSYILKNLIDDRALIKELNKVKYNPIDVFHFGFKKAEVKNKIDGFGVLTKNSDNKKYLGILFNSRIFSHVSQQGTDLYTVLVGGERQKELCKIDTKKLKQIILEETQDLIKHNGEVIMSNHFRWTNGIPQYNLNQEKLVLSIKNYISKNKGFHIIGNYFDGVSVSDCIKKGKKVSQFI